MIKFRAWDDVQKKMLVPDSIEFVNGEPYWIDVSDGDDGCQNDSDPKQILLEQSTGLKDENGRVIYEGDIVEAWSDMSEQSMSHKRFEVVTEDCFGTPGVYLKPNKPDRCYLTWPSIFEEQQVLKFEVIGNIHETSELLEADK